MEQMIGENLKELRKKNRLTQEQLAKELNISASTIRMIEKNLRKPSLDLLEKISVYFDVPKSYILEGLNSPIDAVTTSKNEKFVTTAIQLAEEPKSDQLLRYIQQNHDFDTSYKYYIIEPTSTNITHEVLKNFIVQKKITDPENIPQEIKKIIDDTVKLEIKILLESQSK